MTATEKSHKSLLRRASRINSPRRLTYNPKAVKPAKSSAGPWKFVSTIVISSLAVLLILYDLGKLAFIDRFWSRVNGNLQAHNDQAVHLVTLLFPVALLLFGLLGLAMVLKSMFATRRKSA